LYSLRFSCNKLLSSSSCMVQNESEKSACVCCEAPKPGGGAGPKQQQKPDVQPASKWTCE
jgi:hypothetical protein